MSAANAYSHPGAGQDFQVSDSHDFLIIDGHEDIAWDALEFGRQPRRSVKETRRREQDSPVPQDVGECLLGLPEWQAGGVGIVFSTIFVLPARFGKEHNARLVYETPAQAAAAGRQQLDYYRRLAEDEPQISLLTQAPHLDALLAARRQQGSRPASTGFVLLMEGADPILSPAHAAEWAEAGVRIIGPAWSGTRYTGGTHEPGGLTLLGRDLLKAMAELDLTLDLSHMAHQAVFETFDAYPGTLIASHSNPQRFCPGERGLSDEMIRLLAQRGGVVGVVLFNEFLKPGWKKGDRRSEVPLGLAVDVVDHVAQLTGSAAHVAIGSDFDGGYGLDSIPEGMDSVADLVKIGEGLAQRGYKEDDVRAVLGGNWLRILRTTLA